ncbi:hypothetical protein J2Z66_005892 [Paenibacillus eucommiae]|uniref:Uncharacterized protein n=1 Tax=Paenibacillus eucommiae TaxID=1355755 RepID=A0ABS4J570_9BACL|nr:hypothetical protein [Paenibacillus eucommiae]
MLLTMKIIVKVADPAQLCVLQSERPGPRGNLLVSREKTLLAVHLSLVFVRLQPFPPLTTQLHEHAHQRTPQGTVDKSQFFEKRLLDSQCLCGFSNVNFVKKVICQQSHKAIFLTIRSLSTLNL